MAEDVFGSDQTNEGQGETTSTPDYTDTLSQIVNEEGVQKYNSVDDALKGLAHGSEHIRKIEAENRELRGEVDKRMSAEKVLQELKAKEKTDEKPSTDLTPEALQELVDKRLEARTSEDKAKANEDHVQQAMRKAFGEKSQEIVSMKAQEMGLSIEALRQLSKDSPQAVLKMFSLASDNQESAPTKLHSTVRTDNFNTDGKRNYQWYMNRWKDNPTLKRNEYSQMLKDAETARTTGEEF